MDCASPAEDYRAVLRDFEKLKVKVSGSCTTLESKVHVFQERLEDMLLRLMNTDEAYHAFRGSRSRAAAGDLQQEMKKAEKALLLEQEAFKALVHTMEKTSNLLEHFRRSSEEVRGLHHAADKYLGDLTAHTEKHLASAKKKSSLK
jgi:septation ring formation regulator EzrA